MEAKETNIPWTLWHNRRSGRLLTYSCLKENRAPILGRRFIHLNDEARSPRLYHPSLFLAERKDFPLHPALGDLLGSVADEARFGDALARYAASFRADLLGGAFLASGLDQLGPRGYGHCTNQLSRAVPMASR